MCQLTMELKNAGQLVSCVSEGMEYLRDGHMEMNAEELEATLPLMQLSIANPHMHNNYTYSSASLSSSLPSDHDTLICNDFTIQSPINISDHPILNLGEDDCTTASPFLLPANASTWDAPSFNINNWPNYHICSSAMALDSTTSIFSPHCDNHILDPSNYHHRAVDLSLGTQLYANPNTNAPSPLLPHSTLHPSLYSTTNMQSVNGFQHMLSEHQYYPESHPCTSYSSPDYFLHSHNKVKAHVDFIGNDRPHLQHDSNLNMSHQKQNWHCSFLQHEEDVHQEGGSIYLTTSMMIPDHHQFGQAGYPIVMMNHSQSVPIYFNHLGQDNISPNKHIDDTSACRNQLKVYEDEDGNDKAFVKPSNKRPAPDGDGKDWPPAQSSPPLKRSASWNCNNTLNIILDHTNEKSVAGVSCRDLSPNALEPTNTKQESPTLNLSTKAKARQSVAKDPQSIAARNRRERISERLKILQQLVPNGSKVDLVTMLEKAIGYVKSLQLQVKVLATDEYWPTPLAADKFSLSNLSAVAKLLESTGNKESRIDMKVIRTYLETTEA